MVACVVIVNVLLVFLVLQVRGMQRVQLNLLLLLLNRMHNVVCYIELYIIRFQHNTQGLIMSDNMAYDRVVLIIGWRNPM